MGNYNRLLSGEFPPPLPEQVDEHEQHIQQLDQEMEAYLQQTAEWIHQVKANPQFDKEEGA